MFGSYVLYNCFSKVTKPLGCSARPAAAPWSPSGCGRPRADGGSGAGGNRAEAEAEAARSNRARACGGVLYGQSLY